MAGLNDWSTTAASNASVGSVNFSEGQNPSTVNNSARQLMADVAEARDGTTKLTGWHVLDGGMRVYNSADTTKIVAFDASAVSAGVTRTFTWPNKNGTVAMTSDVPNDYSTAGNISAYVTANAVLQGTFSIPIPASAMIPRATNGGAYGTLETSSNNNLSDYMAFDTTTQEYGGFVLAMPKGWDEGSLTFHALWSHPSTATNFGVVWSLSAVAVGNDDALDVAFGTAQTSTDTGGTTDDLYHSPTSSAITVAGTPAAEDLVQFQITRVVGDASDTLAVDARLHAIVLNITYGQNDA